MSLFSRLVHVGPHVLTGYTDPPCRAQQMGPGKKGDVRLFRNGARQLVVNADTHVLGKFKINGLDIQAVCLGSNRINPIFDANFVKTQ